ncbi:hypothetical protein [Nonlabens xiamenensis]|uniref:hypothetical protein n=1 Tax=Nonlabens xiamenensis TaxID=2341043 RepID=UPI000F611156|nr:hypothetical protein [Nonlabens xiamenensis]
MKNSITKFNQKLLEKHPTIWNTKIVWMLLISLGLHLLFYLIGLVSLMNPASLHGYKAIDIYFKNGMVFVASILSVLLIVIWLISMFRNNAFKNFYPLTQVQLFKQFTCYFVILMAATSFYYSYTLGLQTYIISAYGDESFDADIALANETAPFFSFDLSKYELDQLAYPPPFDTLYCETRESSIDFSQSYFEFKEQEYQYYSIKRFTVEDGRSVSQYTIAQSVFNERKDDLRIFYLKDSVIDVSDLIKTAHPSYFNYHEEFFEKEKEDYSFLDFDMDFEYDQNNPYQKEWLTQQRVQKIQKHQAFLQHADQDAYEKQFAKFLDMAERFQIKTNLDPTNWAILMHAGNDTDEVKHLIINDDEIGDQDEITYEAETAYSAYEKTLNTDFYLDAKSLRSAFKNIDEIKTTNIFEGSIHFYCWIMFLISCVIFIFRTTSLKSLLFSIVSIGLLAIFISLIAALYGLMISYQSGIEYFVSYFVLLLGTGILAIALLATQRVKKIVGSIFLNVSLVGFVPYLVLILGIISMHQDDACRERNRLQPYDEIIDCPNIFEFLGVYWSYLLLALGFLFVFYYCRKIMQWRAMPEG